MKADRFFRYTFAMSRTFVAYALFLAAAACVFVAGLSIFTTYREAAALGEAATFSYGRLFLLAVLAGMLMSAGQYVKKER